MESNSLQHLAIIMDGNGNWAKKQKKKRVFGHIQGMKNALRILEYCSKIKIPYLSFFVLSAENLDRPLIEVKALKNLLGVALDQYTDFLFEKKISFDYIGDISVFSQKIQDRLQKLKEKTKNHKGLHLIAALNYGGRQEIKQAFDKALSYCIENNQKEMDKTNWLDFFPSSKYPPPDLIIRTGGQLRLSNFYLWSSAYSELSFSQKLWPEFSPQDLDHILQDFSKRNRSFGLLETQKEQL